MTFLIPFEDFFKKTLGTKSIENLKISIFKREFLFTLTSTIHRLKENRHINYKGKINMDNFEIQFEVLPDN